MKLISNVTNNFIYMKKEGEKKQATVSITETESVATEVRSADLNEKKDTVKKDLNPRNK